MKKIIVVIVIIASLLVVGGIQLTEKTSPHVAQDSSLVEKISYKGEEGKDALSLLKQKAIVEQDTSGLVVSIKGRKADSKEKEYWAFYVNGKMAPVGPAEYKTKDADVIEWKIEHY